MSSNSGYTIKKHGRWEIICHGSVSFAEALWVLSELEKTSPDPEFFEKIPSSLNARVFKTLLNFNEEQVPVYIKRYFFRSKLDFIKHLFRPGRGKRAFDASLMLRKNGFNAPEPLIIMQKKTGPFSTDNILVSRQALEAVYFGTVYNEVRTSLSARRVFLTEFGQTVGRMHSLGIIHGDMRLSNVLVQKDKGKHVFWFIDNERTWKYRKAPLMLVRKNLVQVNLFGSNIPDTDRMCFMKAYARQQGLSREEMRNIIRLVLDRTTWRIERRKTRKAVKRAKKERKKAHNN
jgi:serine/threonine protein kinase